MNTEIFIFCLLLTTLKLSAQDPSMLAPHVFSFGFTLIDYEEEGKPAKTYNYYDQKLIRESRKWTKENGQLKQDVSQDTVFISKDAQIAIEKFCNTYISNKDKKFDTCAGLSGGTFHYVIFNRGKFMEIYHAPCKKDTKFEVFESFQRFLDSYF